MTRAIVVVVVLLGIVIIDSAFASNPADLTSDHRSFVSEFFKIGYDGGPRFACVNLPIGATVNMIVFNWQTKKGDSRLSQWIVTKNFFSWFNGALDTTFAGDNHTQSVVGNHTQSVVGDIHWHGAGFGVIMPLQADEDIRIGLRANAQGLIMLYTAVIASDASKIYGLSYNLIGINIETAYESKKASYFFRVSKKFKTSFGTLIPESRNRFAKDSNIFGIALGFIPK